MALSRCCPCSIRSCSGYTAFAAGWAVSPRGIGAILAMPVIGVLTNKLDSRWLIACGFVMFGISSLRFGQADLAISQWSFVGDYSQRLWLRLHFCSAIGRHGDRTGKRGDRQCQRPVQSGTKRGWKCWHFHREHHRVPPPASFTSKRAGALRDFHQRAVARSASCLAGLSAASRVLARPNQCARPML